MERLNSFLYNEFISEELENIDSKLIYESLKCQFLIDLAKALKDNKTAEREEKRKEDEEHKKKYGWESHSSVYSKNFKEIFGYYYNAVEWSEIEDKDITKYELPKEGDKKVEKIIRDTLKGSPKCIVVKDSEDKDFLYVIFTQGDMYKLNGRQYSHAGEKLVTRQGRQWKDIPQKDKIDYCKGKNIYVIDVQVAKDNLRKKQNERYGNKQGIVYFDPDSLKRIAEENKKRYEEILRKRKANRVNDDELLKEAKTIIKKCADYAVMVAKDPIRHADLIQLVSTLSKWIYDKREYHSGSGRNQGYYSGVNGLLPTMMKYIDCINSMAKNGGYSFEERDLKTAQENMKKAVEEAKKQIDLIESKIDE